MDKGVRTVSKILKTIAIAIVLVALVIVFFSSCNTTDQYNDDDNLRICYLCDQTHFDADCQAFDDFAGLDTIYICFNCMKLHSTPDSKVIIGGQEYYFSSFKASR